MIQITNKNSRIAMGLILAGILTLIPSFFAKDSLSSQAQTAQSPASNMSQEENQLEDIQSPQWQWQLDSETGTNREILKDEYPLDVNNNSSPSVTPSTEEQDWQDDNKGDPRESGGTVPFLRF